MDQRKSFADRPNTRRSLLAGTAGAVVGAGGYALFGPRSEAPQATRTADQVGTDWVNVVTAHNADPTGQRDSGAAIQAALGAVPSTGGTVYLPAGQYLLSSALKVNANGTTLVGAGQGATILRLHSPFTGPAVIGATGVSDIVVSGLAITGPGPNPGSAPAADGIRFTNSVRCTVQDCYLTYLNGYAVSVLADSSSQSGSIWSRLVNVHALACAGGVHILGDQASAYNAGAVVDSCIFEKISGGDGVLIEDAHDVLISNIEAWNLASTPGSSIHVKGASGAVAMANIDVGGLSGATPQSQATVLIEAGPNGSPSGVAIAGGIVECGTPGLEITDGSMVSVSQIQFFKCANYGLSVSGTSDVLISDCYFSGNGFTAGTGNFDASIVSVGGIVRFEACEFSTPGGESSGQVASAINANSRTYVQRCWFAGARAFGGGEGGYPVLARDNQGYNPVGHVTSPPVPSSGAPLTNPFGQDCMVCVTGGKVSGIAIGGATTGLSSGSFRLPWRQTITLQYASPPSWTWFCD